MLLWTLFFLLNLIMIIRYFKLAGFFLKLFEEPGSTRLKVKYVVLTLATMTLIYNIVVT